MKKKAYEVMGEVEENHWWFMGRRDISRSVLKKYVKSDADILDIGCGTGGNFGLLDEFGECSGVEYSELAVDIATKKHPDKKITCGFLPGNLNIGERRFELISMFDVLEHIDDEIASLIDVKNYLSDNGKLMITVPAFAFLWSKSDEAFFHKRRYTKKHLQNALEQSGYKVEYISYFNFLLFFPALLGKRLLSLDKGYQPSDEMEIKNNFFNSALYAVFSFERHFLPRFHFPFGVSIIAVAHKE